MAKPTKSKIAEHVKASKALGRLHEDPRVFDSHDSDKPDFLRGFYCHRTHTYVSHFTCAVGTCAKNGGKGCHFLGSDQARKSVFFYHVTKEKLPIPGYMKLFYDINTNEGELEITFTKLADTALRKPRVKRMKKPKPVIKLSTKIRKTKPAEPVKKKKKRKAKKVASKATTKKVVKKTTKPKTAVAKRRAAKRG